MGYAKLIKPGDKVDLSDFDAGDRHGLAQEDGEKELEKLGKRMSELQELLFAAHQHSLLIILQGIDTSGKDGTIRSVLGAVNVQSARVSSFKVPTPLERAHDFLWRVHAQAPGLGEITIFNRSHYEDVLAVRVHKLVPKSVWKERFEQINEFEALLASSNTLILKFFLHIDKAEQETRLLAREEDPEKAWKLNVGDWKERELWSDYTKAYEDVLSKCSTKVAPWRVVPANHKWFRNLAVTQAIVQELEPLADDWRHDLKQVGKVQKSALASFRAESK